MMSGQTRINGVETAIFGGKQFRVATAVPGSGTWAAGDTVFNGSPIVGEPFGWRCVVGGTPGTWEPLTGDNTVRPETYGAIGDGVADDSAAILAATTYLNSVGGGVLQFTFGKRYRVATAMSLKRFGRVVWELNGATLFVDNSGSGIMFDIRSSALMRVRNGSIEVLAAFTGELWNLNRDPVGGVSDTFYPVFHDLYVYGTGASGQWGGAVLNLDGCIIGNYDNIVFVGGSRAVKGIGNTNVFSNVHTFRKCTFAQQSVHTIEGLGESWTFDTCVFEPKSDGTIGDIYQTLHAANSLALINCWVGDSVTGTFLDVDTIYGMSVVGGFYFGGAKLFKVTNGEGLAFMVVRAGAGIVFDFDTVNGVVILGGSLQGALVRVTVNNICAFGFTGLTGLVGQEESNRYIGQWGGGSEYVGVEVGFQSGVGIANRIAGFVGEVDWTSLGYPFLSLLLCGSTSLGQDAEVILATRDGSGNPRARIRTHRNGNHFNGGTPVRPLLQARSPSAAAIELGLTQDTFDFGTAFLGSGYTVLSYHRVGRLQTLSTTMRATGPSPPAVTLTLSSPTILALIVDIVVGGARGTATFRTSSDGGVTWTATTLTAATVNLNNGVTVNFPVGTYDVDNVYYGTLAALEDLTTSNLDLAQATTDKQPIVEPFRNGQFAFRGGSSPADQVLSIDPYTTVAGALTAYVVGQMPATFSGSDMVLFSGAASQKDARLQATTGYPGVSAASADFPLMGLAPGSVYIAKFVIDDALSTVDVWGQYGHIQARLRPGSATINKLFWGASSSGLTHSGLHASLMLVSGNVARGSAADTAVLDYLSRLYDIPVGGAGSGDILHDGVGTYKAGITPPLYKPIPTTATGGGTTNYDFALPGDGYYQISVSVFVKSGSTRRETRWVVSALLASGTLTLQASAVELTPQGWSNTNITTSVTASGANLRVGFSHALGADATGRIHVAFGKQDDL
jgi:hypothetical protein